VSVFDDARGGCLVCIASAVLVVSALVALVWWLA
jgi:hypothetical protein